MMRRGLRRVLPRRDKWHALQEYALGEQSQEEFRLLRSHDGAVSGLIDKTKAGTKSIDWTDWESKISNKEVLSCLKDFHAQQSALLDKVLAEDHSAAVKGQTAGWNLFDQAVASCKKSVEKSETIVKNGSRALYISFHNPPISLVSQTEWLDTDQYWQAFVEKHHFYHNHLAAAVEDPESKEYDAKCKQELISKWNVFDGKGVYRFNNKLLYQRPTYEYYDLMRGALVEHMIYYLTKTGGDARFFPEIMPTQWHAEIYDKRFKVYNVLQRRLRQSHEKSLAREAHHDFHPHDLEHDGEGHFMKLIARESAATELMVGRLMGNFILFSDAYIPVQTGAALFNALKADEGKGTFFSLGSDVHCLFYKPAGEALPTPDPTDCFVSLADHAMLTGRRFSPGYATALESFCEILESRKEGLNGCWLTVPGESTKDAFMRRLKKSDPAYDVYKAYAAEYEERWAGAETLTLDQALKEIKEVERKYKLECAEYDNVVFGVSEEFSASSKLEQERLAKLADAGELSGLLDSGKLVAVEGSAVVANADAVGKFVDSFEADRDKAVEVIMATKTALDKRSG